MVPDDEPGDRRQATDRGGDEHGEGVVVAAARSLGQFPLVHVHPS
jgi:hypothetical protein